MAARCTLSRQRGLHFPSTEPRFHSLVRSVLTPLARVSVVQYLDGMGGRYLYVKRTTTVLINLAQLAALTSLGIFYYDLKQVRQRHIHI